MKVAVVDAPSTRRAWAAVTAVLSSAAALSTAAMVARGPRLAIVLACWSLPVTFAALVDWHTARLPDAIVVTAFVGVLAGAAVLGLGPAALGGALLFGVPLLVVHMLRPDGLGFGDVKFGFLLGQGLGVIAVPLVLLAYLGAACIHVAWCVVRGRSGQLVPFGPALAVGSIGLVAVGLLRGL